MPLSQEDDDILGAAYRNLQEKPIAPGHPFYVEIWEHSEHDPVSRLRKHIVWSEIESLQLFSGFSGSGKSTQLRRLQQELEAKGYLVVYAEAEKYLNLGESIEIEELLVTIAGAFSDELDPSLLKDSYWDRLLNYLKSTGVTFKEVSLKFTSVEFKADLKTSPTFRRAIREAIQSRLPEVRRQVEQFVGEVLATIERKSPGQRIVFLFDSFEKLRGTPSNEQEIMASVERLLVSSLDMLQLPSVHCVYSVPAYVQFLGSNAELVLVPTIKICKKRGEGPDETPHEPGIAVLREILKKRFGMNRGRIFGQPDSGTIDKLIEASGGALRDLLRLFREALLAARFLPIDEEIAEQAISIVRNDFKLSVEDAHWLNKIHLEQAADPKTSNAADVNGYMRLLDTHLMLYYVNEVSWYDSHPLVRDEVARIVALNPEP